MATTTSTQDRIAIFEGERGRLTSLAYRTLSSVAEAEDAVQEAWLRFARADLDELREPAAWLTTVVARICLDVLRSARARREAYVGAWLPEPLVSRIPSGTAADAGFGSDMSAVDDPADIVARTDEVSTAVLVMLERLTPEQRVAFVLHDIFALPFEDVAATLDTTPAAARQLASRARRAVADGGAPRRHADLAEQRQAVEAFLAAAQSGNLERLIAILAPNAVFVGDGGGVVSAAPRALEGALASARFILGLFRRAESDMLVDLEPVLVNGDLGLLAEVEAAPGGQLPGRADAPPLQRMRFVMSFTVVNGKIAFVHNQLNPAKLTRVPSLADLRSA